MSRNDVIHWFDAVDLSVESGEEPWPAPVEDLVEYLLRGESLHEGAVLALLDEVLRLRALAVADAHKRAVAVVAASARIKLLARSNAEVLKGRRA